MAPGMPRGYEETLLLILGLAAWQEVERARRGEGDGGLSPGADRGTTSDCPIRLDYRAPPRLPALASPNGPPNRPNDGHLLHPSTDSA